MLLTGWRQWLKQTRRNSRRGPSDRLARKQSMRPRLETLEDRVTPVILTWRGTGGNNLWSNPNNWDNGAPVSGRDDDLVFPFIAGQPAFSLQNDLTGFTFGSIAINSTSGQNETIYTLGGNSLSLLNGIRVQNSQFSLEFASIQLGRNQTFQIDSQRGTQVINSPIALANFNLTTLMTNNGDYVDIRRPISGSGNLVKEGAGILYLSSPSTYAGLTTINNGFLEATTNDALGVVGGRTIVNSGATLLLSTNYTTAEPLEINGTGYLEVGALVGVNSPTGATTSFAGPITLLSASTISSSAFPSGTLSVGAINTNGFLLTLNSSVPRNDLTVGQQVTGAGGIIKTGPGSLRLTGPASNTYTGPTVVQAGTMFLNKENGVAIPGALTIGGAAPTEVKLERDNQIASTSAVTVNAAGKLSLNNRVNPIAALSGEEGSEVSLTPVPPPPPSPNNLTVGSNNQNTTFGGIITGVGNLFKVGTGILELTGNNTFTGTTFIDVGTVLVNGNGTLGTVTVRGSPASVGGTGRVGTLAVQPGGVLAPGATNTAGTLRADNVRLQERATLRLQVNGNQPGSGYDQLRAPLVTLDNGSVLEASLGYAPAVGDRFTFITGNVTGTFRDLPNNVIRPIGNRLVRFTYGSLEGEVLSLPVEIRFDPQPPVVFGQPATFAVSLLSGGYGSGSTPYTGKLRLLINEVERRVLDRPAQEGQRSTFPALSDLSVGENTVTVIYDGDNNFQGNQATLSPSPRVGRARTGLTVTGAPNPSTVGQSVTFTIVVNVVAPGVGVPTGTVTLREGARVVGTAQTLPANLRVTVATADLAEGDRTLTAEFTGDARFEGSTGSVVQKVTKVPVPTETRLTSSRSPAPPSSPITFTAVVTALTPGAGTPIGTITFAIAGTAQAPVNLVDGRATLTVPGLALGQYTVTASFAGTAPFTASSASVTQTVAAVIETRIGLVSSKETSARSRSIDFTATVQAITGPNPTVGSVLFRDGDRTLGTVNLNAQGQARLSSTDVAAGRREITATYVGAGDFAGSSAAPTLVRVGESANQAYVYQVFPDMLGRESDAAGLASWTRFLDQGGRRDQLVANFQNSGEYRRQVVRQMYRKYLGRDADEGGFIPFVDFLGRGGTQDQLEITFLGSAEYVRRNGGGTCATLVDALYRDVLGRGTDPTARGIWCGQGLSPAVLAQLFIGSPENRKHLVNGYFTNYLRRPADQASLNAFVDLLLSGTQREAVIAQILGSQEYAQRLA